MRRIVKRRITVPDAPALGTITVVSSSALTVPLARAATGPTRLDQYELERSTDGTTWAAIATGLDIFGSGAAYPDTGLAAATSYLYRCRARDTTSRYSEWSAAVTANTPASTAVDAPVSVAVVQSGTGLSVSWAAGASGADSFTLYRKGATESSYWARAMGTATTFLDTGMGAASTWSYYVTATLAGNQSAPSAIVSGTTAAGTGDVKWYPGHYAAPDAVLFSTALSAHTTLWNQIGPVDNFVGGEMYVPWGQLEPTTAGNYTFSLIEGQIAALASLGKKAIISVWAHKYGTGSTGGGYFPQYLIDSSDVIVFDDGAGTRVAEACMWREYVADRYMALFAALAAEYEDDDRVAGINTCETSFVNPGLDYSGAALLTQWQRIAAYLPTVLVRTPVFIKANFMHTQADMAVLMQSCVDAGAGMGGPDMFPIEYSGTTDNWGQRCLRGERYVSSAWVAGVAANQQPAIPVLMEQQVIRSTIATPAMFYNAAVTRYSCTHVTWQAKATATLYGSSGTVTVPAMNWLTGVLPYVRDNDVPLRTTIPTAYA